MVHLHFLYGTFDPQPSILLSKKKAGTLPWTLSIHNDWPINLSLFWRYKWQILSPSMSNRLFLPVSWPNYQLLSMKYVSTGSWCLLVVSWCQIVRWNLGGQTHESFASTSTGIFCSSRYLMLDKSFLPSPGTRYELFFVYRLVRIVRLHGGFIYKDGCYT